MADEKKKLELGPTGEQVRQNVRRLREARGMSKKELADEVAGLGRPIPPLGISRIEAGARRVDSDDLVVLAVALNVPPAALLLPVDVDQDDPVEVTGHRPITAWEAWRWMDGQSPLPPADTTVPSMHAYLRTIQEYELHGRPHWLLEVEEERRAEYNRLVIAETERKNGPK